MKKLKVLIVIIILFALNLLSACSHEPERTTVYTASGIPVQTTASLNEITVGGVVRSATSRNIYTTNGFIIERVHIQVGDYVEEGQVLAVLDTSGLELEIAQQNALIRQARQNSQNSLDNARRMLNEAEFNLANNANVHIVNAKASLSAAESALETARGNYNDAQRDYMQNNNPQVLNTMSALTTASLELTRAEREHANTGSLYAVGFVSSDEMRQAENALTLARNQYNDSRISHDNALELEQRTVKQLRNIFQTAAAARDSSQAMLNASRIAAGQEIERLRSQVANAEYAINLEYMEITLKQLERQLNDARITSPVKGSVTSAIAKEGAVGMGLMFTVEDNNNLEIVTSFREYDLARLAPGMEVRITSDGTGSTVYTGVIERINPAARDTSPVVEFEAIIAVTSPETNLRIGMNTRLNIALD